MNRKMTEQIIFKTMFQLANKFQVEGNLISNELTLKQWLLLSILYKTSNDNLTMNSLALSMGVTRQSVKK